MGKVSRTVALALLLGCSAAWAQGAPAQMMFQGKLFRADGTAETAPQTLVFSLYADPAGGSPLWTETHADVPLDGAGFYAVQLGSASPLSGVFDGTPRYLGVALAGQSELGPRLPVVSVPYALRSSDSAMLAGHAASEFALSNHTHPVATSTTAGFLSAQDSQKLASVPDTYGAGLSLSGGTLTVSFAGSGTQNSAARSDHKHVLSCVERTATGFLAAGVTASCQTGEKSTGGGCDQVPVSGTYLLSQKPVLTSGQTTGYACQGQGTGTPDAGITAWSVCCTTLPP